MNIKAMLYKVKPPCFRCPYKLGLVHTVVNPCPQCKENTNKLYLTALAPSSVVYACHVIGRVPLSNPVPSALNWYDQILFSTLWRSFDGGTLQFDDNGMISSCDFNCWSLVGDTPDRVYWEADNGRVTCSAYFRWKHQNTSIPEHQHHIQYYHFRHIFPVRQRRQ